MKTKLSYTTFNLTLSYTYVSLLALTYIDYLSSILYLIIFTIVEHLFSCSLYYFSLYCMTHEFLYASYTQCPHKNNDILIGHKTPRKKQFRNNGSMFVA